MAKGLLVYGRAQLEKPPRSLLGQITTAPRGDDEIVLAHLAVRDPPWWPTDEYDKLVCGRTQRDASYYWDKHQRRFRE